MRWLICSILSLVLCATASAGSVTTREGKTIQGRVGASGSGMEVVRPNGESVRVDWDRVRTATFGDAPATRPALAESWKHGDIGKVHVAGSAAEKGGKFTMTGCGWGAWGPKDSGQFVYWPFEGDGQIIARVASRGDDEGGERVGAMAGVMFRASLEPDSPMAAAMMYPGGEVRFSRRPVEGYVAGPERKQNAAASIEWVRLCRNGSAFTISRSKEGRFWVASKPVTLDLPGKVLAGLFVAAGTNARAAAATFDRVQLVPGTPAATYFEGQVGPDSGVVLVDGSMLAGHPRGVADGNVSLYPWFARDGHKLDWPLTEAQRAAAAKMHLSIPQASVARVRFSPEPPDLSTIAPGDGPGVLLATGDFFEGEIERLSYSHYLDVNSVVFGAKRLEVPREVICARLREVKPEATAYEVRLRDGTILAAKSVGFEGEFIVVESALVGSLRYPTAELAGIRANP